MSRFHRSGGQAPSNPAPERKSSPPVDPHDRQGALRQGGGCRVFGTSGQIDVVIIGLPAARIDRRIEIVIGADRARAPPRAAASTVIPACRASPYIRSSNLIDANIGYRFADRLEWIVWVQSARRLSHPEPDDPGTIGGTIRFRL